MKRTLRLFVASLAGSLTLTALAQPDGPRGHGEGGPRGGPGRGPGAFLVRALDPDHNHELSADEIAQAPAALRSLDRNGDGLVTRDELRPARPEGAKARPADASPSGEHGGRPPGPPTGRGRPVDPVLLALDADGDGQLSAAEIGRATASLLALDLNHDGKLSEEELRPLPPVL